MSSCDTKIAYYIIARREVMTLNGYLYGGLENLGTGFGDLFRKAAILYHLGNLLSAYFHYYAFMRGR